MVDLVEAHHIELRVSLGISPGSISLHDQVSLKQEEENEYARELPVSSD